MLADLHWIKICFQSFRFSLLLFAAIPAVSSNPLVMGSLAMPALPSVVMTAIPGTFASGLPSALSVTLPTVLPNVGVQFPAPAIPPATG